MSERKLEEIESMFKKTAQPKLEIEELIPIKKLGVIVDNTPQGKIALEIASSFAQALDINLDIAISEEFYEAFHLLLDGTKDEIDDLKELVATTIEEKGIYAKETVVLSTKIEQALEIFERETANEEKLSEKLVLTLQEMESDIVVIGVPLFREMEEEAAENLGMYITKLLRERRIHSNFLLVTEETPTDFKDSILAFVSIEQQPGSILACTKRALTLSTDKTKIRIIGLIEDKMIETVARVSQLEKEEEEEVEPDEEGNIPLDLDDARNKLTQKMEETLSSIKIHEDIVFGEFLYTVKSGSIVSMVNTSLEEYQPELVMVRSVAEITENLDPIAEQITRIILRAGIPCLVVWD